MKTLQLNYQFTNHSAAPLKLWLALPSAGAHHPGLVLHLNREAREHHNAAENQVAYFVLEAGQDLQMTCQFNSPAYPIKEALSATMREFYLRSSSLVKISESLRRYADSQVAVAADAKTQARQLFTHILEHFRYHTSPIQRGSLAMLQHKQGDSMELACLYAALCRARGIPCRVIFGALANGAMAPHCWNEIYLDELGWLPVDCGMAKQAQSLWRSLTSGVTVLPWRAYFGALEGPRVVWSLDCDLPAPPNYQQHPAPFGLSLRLGAHDCHWGLELLDDHLPYLQPAYPRLDDRYAAAPRNWRERFTLARLHSRLAGEWRANYLGNWRYPLQKTWSFALYLYAGEIAVSWLHPSAWLNDLRSSTAAVVLGLSGVLLLWQIATSYLARRQHDAT